jgi:hypothetical protein
MDIRQLTARLNQIENNKLYEDLTLTEAKSVKLWEHAGRLIKEANLTPDQIQQIFTSVEQGATAAGGNRTMIGQGKDAAEAIKKAYDDLVSKVQNSGPVKGADAMYDSAVAKIEAGLGGPDNAVNQVIQKYRAFAKANPIAQSLIYAILIAAAGISGVGLGGAAVLGLLKMTDKLLQGEKFSTAVGKGLATGATAFAAGQIGQSFKGAPATPSAAPPTDAVSGARGAVGAYDQAAGNIYRGASGADPGAVIQGAQGGIRAVSDAAVQSAKDAIASRIANGDINPGDMGKIRELAQTMMADSGLPQQMADTAAEKAVTMAMGSMKESVTLSESQIATLFTLIQIKNRQFNEGMWDNIKNKAATVGKNLTTKVTADKLNSAWTKAGSPTDSEQVSQVIQGAGVDPAVVSKAYTDMGIAAPAANTDTTLATPVDPSKPDELADIKKNAGLPAGSSVNTKDMLAQITALTPEEQKQVLAYLKK